jgi:hypothetical protein
MINTYDAQEIAVALSDIYRTKLAQHRVDCSSAELLAVRNFVYEQLSNKIDDSMLQGRQYDPRVNEVVNHVKDEGTV